MSAAGVHHAPDPGAIEDRVLSTFAGNVAWHGHHVITSPAGRLERPARRTAGRALAPPAAPALNGLTDEEYRWEPVAGVWNVRPRGTSRAPIAAGRGDFTIDFAMPEPDPPPVTTIAWRIGHLVVRVLGARVASHFGGSPADYTAHDYPGDAAGALTQLDQAYAALAPKG